MHEYNGNTQTEWQQEYAYDRFGNRRIDMDASKTYGLGFNNKDFTVNTTNNRLGVPSGQSGVMSYDPAGNLTTDTYTGAGSRTYDAEDRMTSAGTAGVSPALYTYDGDGRRVRRNVDGVETWQVYGIDGELMAEYAASGAPTAPQKEYGYRNGQLLITAEPGSGNSSSRSNVALGSNGATATASSSYSSSYPASATINGDRKGTNWGTGGGWNDSTFNTFPDWVEVDFNGSKSIDEIDVITVQDILGSGIEPALSTTFSSYGATGYDVQYWNGSSWVTVTGGSITSNNKVWRQLSFAAVMTTKIRVSINTTADGASRLAEVEAWGTAAPQRTNVALSANGATASASSSYSSSYPASATINGDRKGTNWGSGGGWNDSTFNTFPDWVEVDFNGSKSIDEIDVVTVQDSLGSPVEPTLSTTFSSYGTSGYDVQYWNGTGWTTVTGGSITGNNKVWRQLSFTAVTTSKIRVSINATADGASRLAEIEAWGTAASGGGSTAASLNWLVTDQLGTPRMIFDQTGALATTKRHDYAPFGEELFSGARTSAMGYAANDTTRQKFTSKERDVETGLDYFGARYFASTQGRFTSADPLYIELRRLGDPQQLNLYVYTRNNPVALVDPTGLDIEVTGTQQEAYRKRLQQDVSFQTQINSKTNKVQIVDANGNALDKRGLKALGKTLKGGEKELFNAITDTENHVTIDTVRRDANVDFGRFNGGGKNTVDAADLDLLDAPKNAGGLTSAQVVGHETLEAYAASKGDAFNDAHAYANQFFGGLEFPDAKTLQAFGDPKTGMITQVSFEIPLHSNPNIREEVTRRFLTPIPMNAIPKGHTPAHIVDVEKKP